ncbi:MAG: hypothetical protein N3A38_10970 [Planctomycetota bacterium]|nr:hypothetical protein [Planctomycetota bacterium]
MEGGASPGKGREASSAGMAAPSGSMAGGRKPASAGEDGGATPFGKILAAVARKEGITGKALKGRRLAARVLWEALDRAGVAGGGAALKVRNVRTGIVTVEVGTPAMMQEIESFLREDLLKALREAGLDARELRVRLAPGLPGAGGRQEGRR